MVNSAARISFFFVLLLAASNTTSIVETVHAATLYTVTDIGTLGGTWSIAFGINSNRQIVGASDTGRFGNGFFYNYHINRAFVWTNGVMIEHGGQAFNGEGYSINKSGQIVGVYSYPVIDVHGAFLFDGTIETDLGNNVTATSVNDAGQVVGGKSGQAFVYSGGPGGTFTYLGALGDSTSSSIANGINNLGRIVGSSYIYSHNSPPTVHAFLYAGNLMADLGTLGGTNSFGPAINDGGEIVGTSQIVGDLADHAFLWTNGQMTDLGTLGGTDSQAYAINSHHEIVGWAKTTAGEQRAVLWVNGKISDLNNSVLLKPGVFLVDATGINEAGEIVANGSDGRAYLLTDPPAHSGTITVSTNLDEASFLISGPATYSGNGKTFSQSNAPAGEYTITYGSVSGCITPPSEKNYVKGGGTVTFNGVYQCFGTLNVNATQATESLNGAPFTLMKDGVFLGNETTPYSKTVPIGNYTINYGDESSCTTPSPDKARIGRNDVVTLVAQFQCYGTILVSSTPGGAFFQLSGPGLTYYSGNTPSDGSAMTIPKLPVGDYKITWSILIGGYETPPVEGKPLLRGDTVSFVGRYIPFPLLNSISPTSGAIGTKITLRGDRFGDVQGLSSVRFNTLEAAVLSWTNTEIDLRVPPVPTVDFGYDVTVSLLNETSSAIRFVVTGTLTPADVNCPQPKKGQLLLTTRSTTSFTVLQASKQQVLCSTADQLTADITIENNWNAWYFVSIIPSGTVGRGLPPHFLLPPNRSRVFRLTFQRGETIAFFADATFSALPVETKDCQLLGAFAAEFLWRATTGSPFPTTAVEWLETFVSAALPTSLRPLFALGAAVAKGDLGGVLTAVDELEKDPILSTQLTALGFSVEKFSIIQSSVRIFRTLEFLSFEFIAAKSFSTDTLTICATGSRGCVVQ